MDDKMETPEVQEPLLTGRLPTIVRMDKPTSSGDVCSELAGDFGRWQLMTSFIVFLTKIPAAWYMACIIFTAPEPWYGEWSCRLPTNTSWHPQVTVANGSKRLDYCTVVSGEVIGECEEFVIGIDRKTTLVTQFDLLCSRTILVAITQCFHLFGVLIGGIVGTCLMEKWSPRPVMMVGMIASIPMGLATGYVPYFWLHVACRCLVAACAAVAFTCGGVIMGDVTAGRKKTIVMAHFEQFWSVGVVLLALIGYNVKTWSMIYVTITLPMLAIMLMWFWIPDSPRWHLERGNVDEVQKILESAVRWNGSKVKIPENLKQIIEQQSSAVQVRSEKLASHNNWKDLLTIEGMPLKIFLLFTSFSLILTSYYGTLLNIRSFGRQYLYMTTVVAGLCEIAGSFIGFQILYNCTQKWKIIGMLTAFTGIVTCFIWLLPVHADGNHMLSNLLVISMINKIGISACISLLLTCTAELFPPPHKKRGVFSSVVIARTVFLTAPLIGATVKFGDGVPLTFFGVLTVIGGVCAFALSPDKSGTSALNSTIDPKVWTTEAKVAEAPKV